MKHRYLPFWLGLLLPTSLLAAPPEPPPAKVVLTQVREQELAPTSRLVRAIDFDRISEVSGEISGLIMRQNAVEGALVKKGDPLVELNTDLIRKDMDIKQKQRAQANADLEKVARSMKRLENLLQTNSASRQAYDDARFSALSALKRAISPVSSRIASARILTGLIELDTYFCKR